MIRTVTDDGVDVVLIDRPTKRNALTYAMWRELSVAVERLDRVDTDAPIVVRGADGYFSSGADLGALAVARTAAGEAERFTTALVGALVALHRARRRTVALVDTGAAGGGVEIMLACDARVATGAVTLIFPFGGLGVTLDLFTAWRLTELVGVDAATRLTEGVQRVDDDDVRALGLIDHTATGPAGAAAFVGARPASEPWPGIADAETSAVRMAAAPMLASLTADHGDRSARPPVVR